VAVLLVVLVVLLVVLVDTKVGKVEELEQVLTDLIIFQMDSNLHLIVEMAVPQ
tara:strand:+ start:239 stop:397 length:159 start_codon:yes stop_codon:yes gene_type:complete